MFAKLGTFSLCISVGRCLLFFSVGAFALVPLPSVAADAGATVVALKEKGTVPQLEPPKAALEFSASPTTQELFRARVFEEPLVPIGGEPNAAENSALAAALLGYSQRTSPDDFGSLTDFLAQHPKSAWRAALLTGLGLEYYNTAHYSKTFEAWREAWKLSQNATDAKGKAIADRAAGELAYMYARLGMMTELEALLQSVEGRGFIGSATEQIGGAREGLWNMKNRPEISFRCGPMALQRILLSDQRLLTSSPTNAMMEIFNSASTQKGFSLPQVAELSKKIGLNYQMAFREKGGAFVVPSVVHWKVGHYAGMIRQEGDRYLLQDPTFGNDVWASREALEAETSGYFLIPPGSLPRGWRAVDAQEGAAVWGKGHPPGQDGDGTGCNDHQAKVCRAQEDCPMTVSSVHLMLVNLHLQDHPVGYSPPVGPPVKFGVRYNHREARQPANFTYSNFGPKWTFDWISYITDNPKSLSADVKYYIRGGGTRTFTGFNPNTQSFASQQYDQTLLTRTGTNSYQMRARDGSKLIFSQSDSSAGTARKIFLTQILDPFGNAVTLTYDANLRVTALTDAIGQVTTLSYELGGPDQMFLITRVTDPFGRFATFEYDVARRLVKITDVIGLTSQFTYEGTGDFINSLITPYGTNSFTQGGTNTTRWLETQYPDGSRDRVEYNQEITAFAATDPASAALTGMAIYNRNLRFRNTYYWSRDACATAYGDYTKARIYHWLHTENINVCSGILQSTKEPLESRVWYDYAGQAAAFQVGNINLPAHVGRVLDDGATQLHTYAYDGFGHLTNSIDPVGREMSYVYSTNGIDLLEVRQTRGANNELLSRTTYNAQHLPLTQVDAAGQTNTFTYNARGQMLTTTNPKGETTANTYDTNGYLVMVDGPLPGTNDSMTATYDSVGRTRTRTDESGYTLTFDYDNLDRLTKVTHPDGTFSEYVFNRLDPAVIRDRAGRQTLQEHDAMRQMVKRTDPLNRVTLFQWCSCGDLSSLTDPMGRTTTWHKDVQGRLTSKQYGDGSQVRYFYENASSRLRQVIDEKQQVSQFTYNRDNTRNSTVYVNSTVATPPVSYTYDPNYRRVTSMTDGTGNTLYSYQPITAAPTLGAGQLVSVDGPLPDDTIAYAFDELGRLVSSAINGVTSAMVYDVAGRVTSAVNPLGAFTNHYAGSSSRLLLRTSPNGQVLERNYGNASEDESLNRISYKVGATLVSEFNYGRDIAAARITTWSQQTGVQPPLVHTFGYDAANRLLSAAVTNSGSLVNTFAYTYDPAGNRLTEQIGTVTNVSTHNALNQINTSTGPGTLRTNEWDARDRLVAVNVGNGRTEFTYDGLGRMTSLRHLTNGIEVNLRRFLWCGNELCEERDGSSVVTKRFFPQGVKVETGPAAGTYYYTSDHLGSIRELTDSTGAVRARYSYDPYGRRIKLSGDVDADFGFGGMFWCSEAGLALARYRAYDPELGRWLSRDPLPDAETEEGPNLYTYVACNPVNLVDPLGLCCEGELSDLIKATSHLISCQKAESKMRTLCAAVERTIQRLGGGHTPDWETWVLPLNEYEDDTFVIIETCQEAQRNFKQTCGDSAAPMSQFVRASNRLEYCLEHCTRPKCPTPKPPSPRPPPQRCIYVGGLPFCESGN